MSSIKSILHNALQTMFFIFLNVQWECRMISYYYNNQYIILYNFNFDLFFLTVLITFSNQQDFNWTFLFKLVHTRQLIISPQWYNFCSKYFFVYYNKKNIVHNLKIFWTIFLANIDIDYNHLITTNHLSLLFFPSIYIFK